jgi:prepilin-type N-terminal cleavage/methylation domain-containing protein
MNKSGFTIIELLVVIVVIGILASITIVSYNGVTDRAKSVAAQSAASTVAQKAELYRVETSSYPTDYEQLSGAGAAGEVYQVSGITFAVASLVAAPAEASTVVLTKCDATDGSVGGAGNEIIYWDYSTDAVGTINIGDVSNCTLAI